VFVALALVLGACGLPTIARGADQPPDQTYADASPRPKGLTLPQNLPGASSPPIMLPAYDPEKPQERRAAIDRLFPPLPPLPPPIYPPLGPNERPLTLNDLENLGTGTSPLIRQAEADITAARGNAIQVGTHPNPTVGYEVDKVGS
jgi:hypothetical protein